MRERMGAEARRIALEKYDFNKVGGRFVSFCSETDGSVKIYWGGADTVMCVGEGLLSDLANLCLDHGRRAK